MCMCVVNTFIQMKLCRVFVLTIYIFIYILDIHYRRHRFINTEIPIPPYQKHFCIEKLIKKNTRIHARKQNTHAYTYKQNHTHTTTKSTHNIAYIYMIDYKETRDIVSIEENRQLQTGTSAEVLSATRKNHFYKIKFKKKTQKNTTQMRLY